MLVTVGGDGFVFGGGFVFCGGGFGFGGGCGCCWSNVKTEKNHFHEKMLTRKTFPKTKTGQRPAPFSSPVLIFCSYRLVPEVWGWGPLRLFLQAPGW